MTGAAVGKCVHVHIIMSITYEKTIVVNRNE